MRAKDLIVGRCYMMRVSGAVVPCRLLRVLELPGPSGKYRDVFELENLRTGRTARAYSATKLRREATEAEVTKACIPRAAWHTA
jgi:hypothetical protein